MEQSKLSLRDETKALINSILIPHPSGMFLNAFIREFFNAERRELPYKEMGFNHPLQLLQSMPDAVKCTQMTSGHILVQAVPNKNNQHIKDMVVRQRKTTNVGVQVVNQVLRRQPLSIQQQILSHILPKERHPQPFVRDATPEPKPDTEAQVLSKLQELLIPYRGGVDVDEIRDLYFSKFHKRLGIIESPSQFFSSHPNIFYLWTEQDSGRCLVALREYQKQEPTEKVCVESVKASPPPKPESVSIQLQVSKPCSLRQLQSSYSQRPNEGDFDDSDAELPPNFGVPRPRLSSVFTPNTMMQHQELPSAAYSATCGEYFFIIVAEIYNPSKFYWFLRDKRKAIEKLSDDMTEFYNVNGNDYKLTHDDMYVTQMVAVLFTDNLWYRGRVTRFPGNRLVEVFYVDYGTTCKVYPDQLRHLHVKFTALPVQAFRGRIYGLKPPNDGYKWPAESSKCFLELVKGSKPLAAACMKREYIAINEKDVVDVFVLDLIDTTTEVDLPILEYLIDHGLATSDPEETEHQAQDSGNQKLSPSNSIAAESSTNQQPSPQPTCPFPMPSGQFEAYQESEANQSRWYYQPDDAQPSHQPSSPFVQVSSIKRPPVDSFKSHNLLNSLFPDMVAHPPAPVVPPLSTVPSIPQAIPPCSMQPAFQPFQLSTGPPLLPSTLPSIRPPALPPKILLPSSSIPPPPFARVPVTSVPISVASTRLSESAIPSKPPVSRAGTHKRRYVKPIVLSDGRRFHLLKPDDEAMLYLSGAELVQLLPQFNSDADLIPHLESMGITPRTIHLQEATGFVIDCILSDVPWIKNDEGDVISELIVYEAKIISGILFVLQVKEPEAVRTFNAELKALGDSYWN